MRTKTKASGSPKNEKMAKDTQTRTNTNSKSITPAYHTSTNTGKRQFTQAFNEVERTTKDVFKDDFGRYSNQFTDNHKAEVFVEKSTGRTGFKEEIKYKSTFNFDDKVHGGSGRYETQVKFKKVTFPNQSGEKAALPKSNGYGYSTSKYYDAVDHNDDYYDFGDGAGTADGYGHGEYYHDVDYDNHGGDYDEDVEYDDDGGDYSEDVEYDDDGGDYSEDVEYDDDGGDYSEDVEYDNDGGDYCDDADYDDGDGGGDYSDDVDYGYSN